MRLLGGLLLLLVTTAGCGPQLHASWHLIEQASEAHAVGGKEGDAEKRPSEQWWVVIALTNLRNEDVSLSSVSVNGKTVWSQLVDGVRILRRGEIGVFWVEEFACVLPVEVAVEDARGHPLIVRSPPLPPSSLPEESERKCRWPRVP